jgi:hypothetical protein
MEYIISKSEKACWNDGTIDVQVPVTMKVLFLANIYQHM